jgi:hypothetical protein
MTQKHQAPRARPVTEQTSPQPQRGNGDATPKKEASRVIKLDYPITFADMHYEELTVRRLKAKDFRQLDMVDQGQGNAAAIAITALICGVDEAIIDELDAVDYLKVQEVIADFFPTALVAKLQAKGSALSPT